VQLLITRFGLVGDTRVPLLNVFIDLYVVLVKWVCLAKKAEKAVEKWVKIEENGRKNKEISLK